MSAGEFRISRYQTNTGILVPIKIQPETADATFGGVINLAQSGAAQPGWPSATVSSSRRGIGIHPRTVQVKMTAGMPASYLEKQSYSIPCLSESVWDGVAKGQAVGYQGGTGEVVSKTAENIN